MQQFIMDNRVILAIQGLRSVKKRDYFGVNIENPYGIIWNYKGSDGFMDYETKLERDKIFNQIRILIKERENPIKKLNPNLS